MKPIIALLAALLLFPSAAFATDDDAYTLHNVNLRAGPDGGYPVVATLHKGERLEIKGCISSLQWCEVETRRSDYGWIYAPYLAVARGNRGTTTIIQSYNTGNTRITVFQPRSYWDRHYRDRDFYKSHRKWIRDDDWNDHHGRDWDDDDDDGDHRGRGRGRGRGGDDDRTVVTPYKYEKMEMPSGNKGKYNPLCPMGVSDC